jgi:hypothetical protein
MTLCDQVLWGVSGLGHSLGRDLLIAPNCMVYPRGLSAAGGPLGAERTSSVAPLVLRHRPSGTVTIQFWAGAECRTWFGAPQSPKLCPPSPRPLRDVSAGPCGQCSILSPCLNPSRVLQWNAINWAAHKPWTCLSRSSGGCKAKVNI